MPTPSRRTSPEKIRSGKARTSRPEPKKPKPEGERRIGDEAIHRKTGRTWDQWFRLLDRWGAKKKDHRTIARHVGHSYRVGPWWAQTITVGYEQARGLRELGQRASKLYECSVQRTVAAAPARAYGAWTEPKHLSTWFSKRSRVAPKVGGRYSNSDGDRGEFRIVERNKRLKFTWDQPKAFPGSLVEVTFTRTGPKKTAVRIQHTHLPSKRAFEKMKSGWSWALDSLKSYLETGYPIPTAEWSRKRAVRS